MGSGRWSTNVYDAAARFRAATGASAFAYSDGGATRVHPALDPFGVTVRESRDSAEHPRSMAIAVLFDVTGSMGGVPRVLQAKLPQLLGLIDEVTAKWDTYYILPAGASYAGDRQVLGFWRDLLGQNVIQLADLDAVCETIALTVGLGEDAVDLDGGLADLDDVGSAAGPAVRRALAAIGSGPRVLELAPPDMTVLDATGPEDLDGPGGNARL